jgi:hypothetical protein
MAPLSGFASTGPHDSSLEDKTEEEVINQKNSYKEDPALVVNVETGMILKTSCEEITSPVSFNIPPLSISLFRA